MDPKGSHGSMLLAPSASGGASALSLPGRREHPPVDQHLVQPETTRDEMIRGRRVVAMPALPPHADRQVEVSYVVRAHVKPGFISSAELLTRVSEGSDFATDVCVRKDGTDPRTGERFLEELSFEIVNEQSMRDISEKAEDLTARGVRRVIAIFVKKGEKGEVCEWKGRLWKKLEPDAIFTDPTLTRPMRVRALLDAAEADDAVARALLAKGNSAIATAQEQSRADGIRDGRTEGLRDGRADGLRAAVRSLSRVLSIALSPERVAQLEGMDAAELDALRDRLERDRRWD